MHHDACIWSVLTNQKTVWTCQYLYSAGVSEVFQVELTLLSHSAADKAATMSLICRQSESRLGRVDTMAGFLPILDNLGDRNDVRNQCKVVYNLSAATLSIILFMKG